MKQDIKSVERPKNFAFPLNYEMRLDLYSDLNLGRLFELKYKIIMDSYNNRLKVDSVKKIHLIPDR